MQLKTAQHTTPQTAWQNAQPITESWGADRLDIRLKWMTVPLFDLLVKVSFASEISFPASGLMTRWSFSWPPRESVPVWACFSLCTLNNTKGFHRRMFSSSASSAWSVDYTGWKMMILPVGLLFHGIWFIRRNRRWLFHNQREVLRCREGAFYTLSSSSSQKVNKKDTLEANSC